MSSSRLISRWQGLALSLVGVVATVWLGFTGQLGLYIHPRYYVFTLIMAAIAVVLIVGAFAVTPGDADDGHGHGHGHGPDGLDHLAGGHGHDAPGSGDLNAHEPARGPGRHFRLIVGSVASVLVVAAAIVALLIVPPATLTSATVAQRSINNAQATLSNTSSSVSTSDDTSSYTVKNWSLLMRQGVGLDYFDGRAATITGFVTPDADDPENVFFVARFVVTCCAVDAQPVGVAVYQPGWQNSYPVDSWVSVDGAFGADPSVLSTATIVMQPDRITAIPQPDSPYVY